MNWDDLRYFLAAVRLQTFSGAGRELGVNRTTVARRIAQLERQLGQTLFVHEQNTYRVTDFGEELYQQATELEQSVAALEEKLELGSRVVAGNLRIAAPLGLGPEFLPELSRFSRAHPQVRWELLNTLDPMAALNQRQADVAIAVSHGCPNHLKGHCIGDLQRALYASKAYLRRIPARRPLAEHHWIGWGQDLAESQAARWMARELPREVYKPAEVNSWNAILAAVRSGLGVAHLWCFLADRDHRLRAIRPPTTELSMGLWLMRPLNIPPNPRVRAFFTTMAELLQQRIN